MKGLRFFLGVLTIISLTGCAATRVVTPEISCTPTMDVQAVQPHCSGPILSAINNPNLANIQDAMWCYDRVVQHWMDAYEICIEKVGIE